MEFEKKSYITLGKDINHLQVVEIIEYVPCQCQWNVMFLLSLVQKKRVDKSVWKKKPFIQYNLF
jgi:hypothetical protein